MKKSRIKYLGMVAAALLAAAPITASMVSTVEVPVYAADQTPALTDVEAIRADYANTIKQGNAQIKEYDQKLADVESVKGIDQVEIESDKAQAESVLSDMQVAYDKKLHDDNVSDEPLLESIKKGRAQIGEYDQILEKIAAAKDIDTVAIKDSKDKAQTYIDNVQAKLDGFNAAGIDADAGALQKSDAELAGKPAGYIDGYRQGYQLAANILNFSAVEKAAKADVDNGTKKSEEELGVQGPLYTKLYNNYYDAIQGVYAGTADGKKGQKQDLTGKSAAYQRGYNEAYAQYYQAPTKPVTPTYPTIPGTTPIQTVDTLTESPASGIAYVTAQAGIPLYSDKETINQIGRTLTANSSWKIFGQVTNSAGTIVAYNLGGKQYVKASDVTLTNPVTKGTFTVHYSDHPTWGIAVYNGALKVQKIIPAGSRWVTYGKKTINGQDYYNLGGDQFARADYGSWIAD
ncbi:SLAP domain-containing protein [Schleiferilactobacillus harbinensis]|nr:SLAP domain-containing protein [Schleiferilactobacillus harbinensis]